MSPTIVHEDTAQSHLSPASFLRSNLRKLSAITLSISQRKLAPVRFGSPLDSHAVTLSPLSSIKKQTHNVMSHPFSPLNPTRRFTSERCSLDLTNVNGDALRSPASDDDGSELEPDDLVLPPSTRRPPGRPKKRRIRGQLDEVKEKRVFTCSRCKNTGHSRRTCQEAINTTG
jgi:hypothetical protein